MRKGCLISIIVLILCLLLNVSGSAEIPDVDLSTFSLEELTRIKTDITSERKNHHEINSEIKDKMLKTGKQAAEQYFVEKGFKVSWPWLDWDYKLIREYDLFKLTTFLNYEDENKKSHKVNVYAEMYYDGADCGVYRLMLDEEEVFISDYPLPDNLLIDTGSITVNEITGINLSLLNADELKDFEQTVQKEIETNHTPRNTDKVNEAVKKDVEAHFTALGVSVNWPWFDYTYTCDWDCYTENTRITYELDGIRHKDEPVYAEVFPDSGQYRVFYLTVGDHIIFDERDKATDANALLFLRKRTYVKAKQLLADEKYEDAYALLNELGDFEDSPELKKRCVASVDQLQYEEALALMTAEKYDDAISAFEALGDYSDSRQLADRCRESLLEKKYQHALTLIENENYAAAAAELSEIASYKDSQQKISECETSIAENAYNQADQLMTDGKYDEAIAAFISLNGYKDSENKIRACQEKLNSQKYEEAKALFEAGNYTDALNAFTALGDYKNSLVQAANLREIVRSIDRTITLSESEYYLIQGQKIVLKPQITQLNQEQSKETKVVFSSTDPNVVRVGKDGSITGVKPGNATILCAAADNHYIMTEVSVHVVKNVKSISISASKVELSIPEQNGNSSIQLEVIIEPEDAYIKTGTWSSSNEKVATVDHNGNVKAVSAGRAAITFTSDDQSKGKKKVTCNVTVVQAVTSVDFPEDSGTVYVGKTLQLKPEILPKNADVKKIAWTSSDESVATVSAKGVVKGISPGEATITAISSDGPSGSYSATVKMPPVILKVSGSAKCVARNHVGHNCSKGFTVNGEDFNSTTKVPVEIGDTITVGCWIEEDDKIPDWDGFTEEILITPEIMTKGTKLERTVFVTENGGRYSGYSAEWDVVITIRP